MARVVGRNRAGHESGRSASMKSTARPNFAKSLVSRSWVPPYRQLCASRWSPADSTVSSVVEIAAMPLAVTSAACEPSSAASLACSAPKVRLSLEYATVSLCLYGETAAGATTGTVSARRQYSGWRREHLPRDAPDRALFQPGGELRPLPPGLPERRHRSAQDPLRTVARRGGGGYRLGHRDPERAAARERGASHRGRAERRHARRCRGTFARSGALSQRERHGGGHHGGVGQYRSAGRRPGISLVRGRESTPRGAARAQERWL